MRVGGFTLTAGGNWRPKKCSVGPAVPRFGAYHCLVVYRLHYLPTVAPPPLSFCFLNGNHLVELENVRYTKLKASALLHTARVARSA